MFEAFYRHLFFISTLLTIYKFFELAQKEGISLATRRTKYLITRCLITGKVEITFSDGPELRLHPVVELR